MRKLIKVFLSILIVILCILIFRKIKLSDTNTIDLDYWVEEETALFTLNKLIN